MKCSTVRRGILAGAMRPLDVAAIVCVVAWVAGLVYLGTAGLRQRLLRSRCQANLRQIGQALQLYARDSKGLLPDCSLENPRYASPVWPWDMHTNLVSDLEARGLRRPNFYCPANSEMNDDRHWNFFRADPAPTRVLGYGSLFKGTRQVPRSLWCEKIAGDGRTPPAQAELSFDATAAIDDDFTFIQGTWRDRSNHVRDKSALGGNILFLDGHVEWRDFSDMQVRFSTISAVGRVEWSY